MAEETFEPIRMLAELNALGVRFVLVSELASKEPVAVLTADPVEICVADDDEDIDRLRAMLVALEAEQEGSSDDPHRAVFRTPFGRLECVEMAADAEFSELERRAGHVDFGRGVIVRAARLDTRAHRPTSAVPAVEAHEPGREPEQAAEDRTPVTRRLWQKLEPKLEHIDDLLSGSGGRSRGDHSDPSR
jgi:hypothetical protein